MSKFTLTHLSDQVLLSNLGAMMIQGRAHTAVLLAHIAEVEERRLYAAAGWPSMYEYCVREFHLSEYEALTRIRAARTARKFPSIFVALSEGRLHMSAVVLLAKKLNRQNAAELLGAVEHKTCQEIRDMLAARFPEGPVPTKVVPIQVQASVWDCAENSAGTEESAGTENSSGPATLAETAGADPGDARELALSLVLKRPATELPRHKVRPLSPENYALQCTIRRETHERLERIQAMLRHQLPSGDLPEVIDQAFAALEEKLQKAKFAATERPRARKDSSAAARAETARKTDGGAKPQSRHIPAEVKRAVWNRDGGQCTFVGSRGHRCPARSFLEFDHMEAFARGGQATVEGIRLLCRAHNQYAAEQTFGAGFMRQKREEARHAVEKGRAQDRGP
jgi:5-methylcytosine-specific restriction endonuclease McrA